MGKGMGDNRFSREDLLDHLEAYYWRTGEFPTSTDIRNADREEIPCPEVFSLRFGSVSRAVREMIVRLDEAGVKVG